MQAAVEIVTLEFGRLLNAPRVYCFHTLPCLIDFGHLMVNLSNSTSVDSVVRVTTATTTETPTYPALRHNYTDEKLERSRKR